MHCLCSVIHFPKLCLVSFGKHRAVSGISVYSPCCLAGFYPELILKWWVYGYIVLKKRKFSVWELGSNTYPWKCFTYTILPIQVLPQSCEVGISPQIAVEETRLGKGARVRLASLSPQLRFESWCCFTLKDYAAFPILAGSTASIQVVQPDPWVLILILVIYLISCLLSFLICKMGAAKYSIYGN